MIFYSHIDRDNNNNITAKRELGQHLINVASTVKDIIANSYVENRERLSDIGWIVGLCHDFGKFTTYFQDYLLENTKLGQKKNHGFISALFSSYQIKHLFKDEEYMPLFVYFMVLHHHGDLKNLDVDLILSKESEYNTDLKEKLDITRLQLEDMTRNIGDIKDVYRKLDPSVDVGGFLQDWEDFYDELNRLKFKYINSKRITVDMRIKYSIYMLFIYSALIDSDKREAGRVGSVERKKIPAYVIDRYRHANFSDKHDEPMAWIRDEIYDSVNKNIKGLDLNKHILTITAPTGSGKTITGFSAAVNLRGRINSEKGYTPRIVYALPFTSIIDQNYDTIHKILEGIDDFKENENLYIIKHHHLADVKYMEDDKERPVDESLALIEAWESEIVVTTFIQFFYTLIGYRNRMLKKYHNIAGSIVILDEVQNIPMEYWGDVGKVLKYTSEILNMYIILMTATKPLIFGEGEYVELVDTPDKYFKGLDRVSLLPNMEEMDIESFTEEIVQNYDPYKSYMIVMNTIVSSIEVFEKLKEKMKDRYKENMPEFIYLSANIVPYRRKRKLEEVKRKLKAGKKLFIVSTQVVEAGVDIDLDVVIRDIGPFDSIMQVAGRCNRENGPQKGKVFVYNLIRDSGRYYYEHIYGKVHCFTTREILKDEREINESSFLGMIEAYFEKARERTASVNGALVKAIADMRFDDKEKNVKDIEYVSDFELIDELPGYVDVFIETDDDVEVTVDGITKMVKPSDIFNFYKEGVLNTKDMKKKKENYLKIKKYFREFVISVNSRYLPEELEVWHGSNLYRISADALDLYYDDTIGFKRVRDESIFV